MNLKNLETRLDDALNNETKESLTQWLGAKRDDELEQLAKKHTAIFSDWQGEESHVRKLAFKIGYQIAKKNITKETIIEEAEEIHQKEIQKMYSEEEVLKIIIAHTDFLVNEREFLTLSDWFEQYKKQ